MMLGMAVTLSQNEISARAAKFAEKEVVLDYWLEAKYPSLYAELAKAKSGYSASVSRFEELAPMVSLAD